MSFQGSMECRVDTAVTVDSRVFHAVAAATRNARSPSDDLLVAGTTSAGELDDLRHCECVQVQVCRGVSDVHRCWSHVSVLSCLLRCCRSPPTRRCFADTSAPTLSRSSARRSSSRNVRWRCSLALFL